MKTSIAAAALALLCSFAANAGGLQRTFQVGAVVVASASVSSTVTRADSRDGISVRTGGYRAPQAAVLVDGNVQVRSEATGTGLGAPASGDAVVTLLY